ncbi:bifunctional hydroxymethylpyrimidine kinase/phosphomethylpyrimidine kinase [Paracoccus caeni]|uniref:hydroxymethylpyrimidine kinase n=1 Tax=Paracoccus caeni TaxID=657651 RepID=A0A934SH50_9RHOB|nr:bifunctional hydroxymethylpyrimidine kinase/phosphomethylpyrimidine kinase [Paracoccus caeni]MBK4217360.1 bifunctional hydroxymethylpyrimidine kinase/phosphomethylpyrimidine kinase [Paracoccus caeni]
MQGAARLLIIAGSDSGGGAGIQADLKSASARGVYAATAITAITAQNTLGVQAVEMLPTAIVRAQIASVLDDIDADAIKIGMLGSAAITVAVAEALQDYPGPIVLDPVMVAKSGDALLDGDAIRAMRELLLPRATLLTPNLPEAASLLGAAPATTPDEVMEQGQALLSMGPKAVLMKGGHAEGSTCTDWLVTPWNSTGFTAPRIATQNTHGTGCSLSSAIAAELAKGVELLQAVETAHDWLHHAIAQADLLRIGTGHGPVHHFHGIWP